MSWSKAQVERMSEIQLQIQDLVAEADNAQSPVVDALVEANEALTEAQGLALEEHRSVARGFAEALRPFAEPPCFRECIDGELAERAARNGKTSGTPCDHSWDGPRIRVNDSCFMATCSKCGERPEGLDDVEAAASSAPRKTNQRTQSVEGFEVEASI